MRASCAAVGHSLMSYRCRPTRSGLPEPVTQRSPHLSAPSPKSKPACNAYQRAAAWQSDKAPAEQNLGVDVCTAPARFTLALPSGRRFNQISPRALKRMQRARTDKTVGSCFDEDRLVPLRPCPCVVVSVARETTTRPGRGVQVTNRGRSATRIRRRT